MLNEERSLITLWFHPNYSKLPASLQVKIYEIFTRKSVDTDPDGLNAMTLYDWPKKNKSLVEPFFPSCPLNEIAEEWNRNPKWK